MTLHEYHSCGMKKCVSNLTYTCSCCLVKFNSKRATNVRINTLTRLFSGEEFPGNTKSIRTKWDDDPGICPKVATRTSRPSPY